MGKKISELDRAASLNNGDLFVLSQVDAQSETGYKSVSTPVSDAAQKFLKGIEFPTDLNTESKNVIGAINEVFGEVDGITEEDPDYPTTRTIYNSELTWIVGFLLVTGQVRTDGSYANYHHAFIDVKPGDVLNCITRIRAICLYNNDTVVPGGPNEDLYTYTIPQGVNRIGVTRLNTYATNFTLDTTGVINVITKAALEKHVPEIVLETVGDMNDVVVNLPSKIYALTGLETNIYFENIVEDYTKYDFDVTCSKGKQMARGFTISPTDDDVGTYNLTIKISKSEEHYKTISTTLVIVGSTAGSGDSASVIILGDSTTANGIAVSKLHENFNSGSMSIATLGTMGTAPNNHEGRSGWRLEYYFTRPYIEYDDYRGTIYNAFYNPSTESFDANYYFNNSGISKPDWFFINMGINDVFGYATDETLQPVIEQCIDYIDSMISSVRSASPNTKVGVCLTIPPNHSQDAFGKAYGCSQTRNRYKRNNLLFVNRLISEYDNKEANGVFLVPIFTNLDTVFNMGLESIPVNSRNSETYQSPIANGGVHPVESGYWQVADIYTAFIKANV